MLDRLRDFIDSIEVGDEVIVTSFAIDERVVHAMLEKKLASISKLRLVFHGRLLKSPGYIDPAKELPNLEIVRTSIRYDQPKRKGASIFHSKIFAIVRKKKIKRIAVSSFNWTSYHFKKSLMVFDSLAVFEDHQVAGLNAILAEPEFCAERALGCLKRSPCLFVFREETRGKYRLEIHKSQIQPKILDLRPERIDLLAAPYLSTNGVRLLLGDEWESMPVAKNLRFAPSASGGRLHGKFLIGTDADGREVLWLGSMNFTENAIGGNNHESIVICNHPADLKDLRSQLEKYELWTKLSVNPANPEDEPSGVESLSEASPQYARIIESKGALLLEVLMPKNIGKYSRVALVPPKGEAVDIKTSPVKKGRVISYKIWEPASGPNNELQTVLETIVTCGRGQIAVQAGTEDMSIELDLGPLWGIVIAAQGRPVTLNAKKGTKEKNEKEISSPFNGTDVRPLRLIAHTRSKLLRGFLGWIHNKPSQDNCDWTANWKVDPWKRDVG